MTEHEERIPRFEHPVLKEVYEAMENLNAAELLLKEAQEQLQESILDLPYKIGRNKELQEAVIAHLFWNEEIIRQTWLAKAFNTSPYHIREMAAQPAMINCRECKQPFEVLIKKRDGTASWNDRICPKCDEAQKLRWRQEEYSSQIEQSAWGNRVYELRTMPYYEYLQTSEWQARRQRIMKKAGFRCQVCNAYGVQLNVHHRTYERRGNEYDQDLIVLCSNCHQIFHDNGSLASDEE